MYLRTQPITITCFLLMSLLMMSFNASASVVVSFGNYDICPIDAANTQVVYADAVEHSVLALETNANSTSHCCMSAVHALYPPSALSQSVLLTPSYSLALIERELSNKTNILVQSLYKPPIS